MKLKSRRLNVDVHMCDFHLGQSVKYEHSDSGSSDFGGRSSTPLILTNFYIINESVTTKISLFYFFKLKL